MDFYSMAHERYSVRRFAPIPVEPEKLQKILESAQVSPSAKNIQPWQVYVIQNPEMLAKLKLVTRGTFHAPVVFLICGKPDEAWVNVMNNRSSVETDVSIFTTSIMFQAWELGLGSTWIGWLDSEKAKEVFELPEGVEPYCLLPIGYPAENAEPGPMHPHRKSIEEFAVFL